MHWAFYGSEHSTGFMVSCLPGYLQHIELQHIIAPRGGGITKERST